MDLEMWLAGCRGVATVASIFLQNPSRDVEFAGKQSARPGFSREDVNLIGDGDMESVARDGCDEEALDAVAEDGAPGDFVIEIEGSEEASQHQAFRQGKGNLLAHPPLDHQPPRRPAIDGVAKGWEELYRDFGIVSVVSTRTHSNPALRCDIHFLVTL
jgi:hypothetical protein